MEGPRRSLPALGAKVREVVSIKTDIVALLIAI
jgi:hypothetical protein